MVSIRGSPLIGSRSPLESIDRQAVFTKAVVRLFPQPAPRGYPARWSRVAYQPYTGDETKLDDLVPRFGHALAIFRTTGSTVSTVLNRQDCE